MHSFGTPSPTLTEEMLASATVTVTVDRRWRRSPEVTIARPRRWYDENGTTPCWRCTRRTDPEADAENPVPTLTLEGADASSSSGLPDAADNYTLAFNTEPDFEDPDGYRTLDNEYQVTVVATDRGFSNSRFRGDRW